MLNNWYFFLLIIFLCLIIEGFFSMMEMAVVSLNKIRLNYYATQKNKKALKLTHLLAQPSRLFGTTLLIVNTVVQIGSEAARRFYESLHLSPDWAPFTQTMLVVIFAELAPLFAARRHAEQVALQGSTILMFFANILSPVIWLIDKFSHLMNRFLGADKSSNIFLSKEEIKRAFEEKQPKRAKKRHVDVIVDHIFMLKNKIANELMRPLDEIHLISSPSTVEEVMQIIEKDFVDFLPIYCQTLHNIVGIVYPNNLLKASPYERISSCSISPWFVTKDALILDLLEQFRFNNQRVAVVLNEKGQACGFITLEHIMDEIFGPKVEIALSEEKSNKKQTVIERTLSGDMTLEEFNKQFHAHLSHEEASTISDLLTAILQHHPSEGEIIYIDRFEFCVIEPSLLGVKVVAVKSIH